MKELPPLVFEYEFGRREEDCLHHTGEVRVLNLYQRRGDGNISSHGQHPETYVVGKAKWIGSSHDGFNILYPVAQVKLPDEGLGLGVALEEALTQFCEHEYRDTPRNDLDRPYLACKLGDAYVHEADIFRGKISDFNWPSRRAEEAVVEG